MEGPGDQVKDLDWSCGTGSQGRVGGSWNLRRAGEGHSSVLEIWICCGLLKMKGGGNVVVVDSGCELTLQPRKVVCGEVVGREQKF